MELKMIGSKIAKARKEINMSQAQLVQRLFISPQAVGKWERGESIPDIITFNRLAEIVGVDLNYFSENFQSDDQARSGTNIESNHDTSQTIEEVTSLFSSPEQYELTNFSGSNLAGSDFAGVTAHKSKFKGSALRGSDFAD